MFLKKDSVFPSLDLILAIGFLLAISYGAFSPWRSIFIQGFVQNRSLVGVISTFFSLFLVPFYLIMARLILKFGKVKTLLSAAFLMLATAMIVGGWSTLFVFLLGHSFYLLGRSFAFFVLELLIKKYSPENEIHFIQGKLSAIVNFGWFLGPILGGFLVSTFSISGILWFMVVCAILALILVLRGVSIFDPLPSAPPTKTESFFDDLKEFSTRSDFLFYYLIAWGLNMVYGLTTTFLPLLLWDLGASNQLIGIGFALSVLPFVVLEPIFGRLADKIGHERQFFSLGFLIMAVSLILTGFSHNSYFLIILLLFGSIGASFIEAIDQSLFMKRANHHKTSMIGIFSTAGTLGFASALLLSAVLLIFVNLSAVFVILGFLLLSFCFISLRSLSS